MIEPKKMFGINNIGLAEHPGDLVTVQEVENVDRESTISVKYKWALKECHSYKTGATFQFYLPEELKVYEAIISDRYTN